MEEKIREKLKDLVQQFESNIKEYKGKYYDEANTRVDLMVYKLYGLTEEEIKIVEGEEN